MKNFHAVIFDDPPSAVNLRAALRRHRCDIYPCSARLQPKPKEAVNFRHMWPTSTAHRIPKALKGQSLPLAKPLAKALAKKKEHHFTTGTILAFIIETSLSPPGIGQEIIKIKGNSSIP